MCFVPKQATCTFGEAGREPGPPRTPIPLATRDSPDLDQHDPAADLVTAPATASGAEELGDAPNLCLFRICYAVMNDHSVLILEGTNINHTCCPVRAQGCNLYLVKFLHRNVPCLPDTEASES